jgi:hypothetical protein
LPAGRLSWFSGNWNAVVSELAIWGTTSCRRFRGIVPRRFIALVQIPKGRMAAAVVSSHRQPFGLCP